MEGLRSIYGSSAGAGKRHEELFDRIYSGFPRLSRIDAQKPQIPSVLFDSPVFEAIAQFWLQNA